MKPTPFRTYEDFEAALKNEAIPEPRTELWTRLSLHSSSTSRRTIIRKPILFLAILCISLILSAGASAVAWNSKLLHQKDGKVALEYGQTSQEQNEMDRKIREIMGRQQWKTKVDEIQQSCSRRDVHSINCGSL